MTIAGGLLHFGVGNDSVDVPLTVTGNPRSFWPDRAPGRSTARTASTRPRAVQRPANCTTTIGAAAIVDANSGTLTITDLTNVGGNTPNNTLTGGTYNIADRRDPAAPDCVDHRRAAPCRHAHHHRLRRASQDTSGSPGLAHLASVDLGATLGFSGSHSNTTALTTISGTVILDGSSTPSTTPMRRPAARR